MKLPELSRIMVAGQYDILNAAAEGCDAIVATGLFPSRAAAETVAESRNIYFASVHFCPQYLPSLDIPPLEFAGRRHPEGMSDIESLWNFNIQVMNDFFGDAVNEHRVRIGLKSVPDVREQAFTRRPWLATDPVLGPWRPSRLCDGVQTGAWTLPDDRPLPEELMTFLDDGSAPVYVGFGSMAMRAAPDAARVAIDAIRTQGRRVLIARGVAGLEPIDDRDDCFTVGEINQQALFPKVAAVVHHGGAGTTVAAAQAGAPQLIVPQVADQTYWASQVVRLGIGAAHQGPVPTAGSMEAGLDRVLAPQTKSRAKILTSEIRSDGAMIAARRLIAALH